MNIDALLAASTTRRRPACWWCALPTDHPARPYLEAVLELETPSATAVQRILDEHFAIRISEHSVRRWLSGDHQCH